MLADGSTVHEPVMRITPRDLALVVDRLQILFGRPGTSTEERSLSATITTEPVPVDLLKGIIEMSRGLTDTPRPDVSLLPRLHRRPEN